MKAPDLNKGVNYFCPRLQLYKSRKFCIGIVIFFFSLSFSNCISCVSTAMIFAFILTLLLIIGLRLRMLGISKAKLKPIVKPHLMGMKTTIVPLVRHNFLLKKFSTSYYFCSFSYKTTCTPNYFTYIFVYTGVCVSVTVFYRVDGIIEC